MKKNIYVLVFALLFSITIFSQTKPAYFPIISAGFDHSFVAVSSFPNNNSISSECIFGQKVGVDQTDNGIEYNDYGDIYNVDKAAITNIGSLVLMKKGDLNGDGMDDIISIYNYSNFTKLYAFDGNTGKILFEYYDKNYGIPNYYLLEIGDYNGDGKDEIAVGRHTWEGGTFIQFLDGNGKLFSSYSPQELCYGSPVTIGANDPVFCMKSADVNNDGYDDLVLVHYGTTGSYVRAIDVKNSSKLYQNFISGTSNRITMIDRGDFDGDGNKDDIAYVLDTGINYSDLYIILDTTNPVIKYHGNSILKVKFGKINSDNVEDLLVIEGYGWNSTKKIYDNTFVTAVDLSNNSRIFPMKSETRSGFGFYDIEIGNFDGIGGSIAYVRHAGNYDFNNDGVVDGSFLEVLDSNGNTLNTYSSGHISLITNVEDWEGIDFLSKGDFNADGYDELNLIHFKGNSNGIKTGSVLRIWDPKANTFLINKTSTEVFHNAVILDNQITDKELLRSLNTKYASFDDYFDAFFSNSSLIALYLEDYPEKHVIDYYPGMIISSLKKYSTFSKFDFYNAGTTDIFQDRREFSMWGDRIKRLENTLNELIWKGIPDKQQFKYLIKSILSHTRLLSTVDNINLQNHIDDSDIFPNYYWNLEKQGNIAVLFVAQPMHWSMRYLKDFKDVEKKSLENFIDEKIRRSMVLEINDDGTFVENSFMYNFHYNFTLAHMANFKVNYLNQFFNSSTYAVNNDNNSIVGEIKSKLAKTYEYYLWAIKPNETNRDTNNGGLNFQTDLPINGDGFSPIEGLGGHVGKTPNDLFSNTQFLDNSTLRDKLNILEWPLLLKNINGNKYKLEPMIDESSSLYHQLTFATLTTDPNSQAPISLKKIFPNGGIFIARSNWDVSGSYDYNARHCQFRLTPFSKILDPGHQHSDLLSVEMTGYNKEFFVDPGGYQVTEQFGLGAHFNSTYGIDFKNKGLELTNGYYFSGTAVHNTVYIGNTNQATGYFGWLTDYKKITPIQMYNESDYDWDYASAGYTKIGFDNNETHKRQLLYVNTRENVNLPYGKKNDYWVVIDNVTARGSNTASLTTDQTWHLAPWCTNTLDKSNFNASSNWIIKTNNFWMLPLNLDNSLEGIIVDSYMAPQKDLLFPTKIVKYRITKLADQSFSYATIILPFLASTPVQPISLKKIPIYKTNIKSTSSQITDNIGIAFKFRYIINGLTYEDNICVINDYNGITYYWDKNNNNTMEAITKKITFDRALNASRLKSANYQADGTNISIFPNPATNLLNIDIPGFSSDVSMSISDINSRIIRQQKLKSSSSKIDISGLSNGIYLLKLINDNGKTTIFRFVKD